MLAATSFRKERAMNDSEQAVNQATPTHSSRESRILVMIKLLHSAVWLFMATCILLIPWAASEGRFQLSAAFIGVITMECAVLVLNRGKCPLTSWAALYTKDRRDNFDIYLPLWLARHNKAIFGTLFVCVSCFAVVYWIVAD